MKSEAQGLRLMEHAWPTLAETDELFRTLRAGWLVPYRAQRTHCVARWSSEDEQIYRQWEVQTSKARITAAQRQRIQWMWGTERVIEDERAEDQALERRERAAREAYWETTRPRGPIVSA